MTGFCPKETEYEKLVEVDHVLHTTQNVVLF